MSFQSLKQIKASFGISADDPELVRRELRRRLKKVHPDTSAANGEPSGGEPEEALRITSALNFLDGSKNSKAVVPVEEVSALVKALKDLAPPDNRQKELEARLLHQIDTKIQETKSEGRIPRFVLTAVAGLMSLVWLFPSITGDNPVLREYVNVKNPVFNIIWLAFLIYTGAVWLVFKMWGQREVESRKKLKLESAQNRLFESFIMFQAEYQSASGGLAFNKDQFVSHIVGTGARNSRLASLLLGRPMSVDSELAQSLAEIILCRAENRGVLRRDETQSLKERYTLMVAPGEL